ncbi:MAG: hypothetical protein ACTSUE_12630 [Promethearchaeota archaeon]
MSKGKILAFIIVFQALGVLFLIMQVYFLDLEDESSLYVNVLYGLLAILLPLIPLGTRPGEMKEAGLPAIPFYISSAAMSAGVIYIGLMPDDMLIGSALILITAFCWSYALYMNDRIREGFKTTITRFSRGTTTFLMFFMGVLWFWIPATAHAVGINSFLDSFIDILVGASMMCLLVFAWLVSKYRIAGIPSGVLFAYWYMEISQWMLRNRERVLVSHEGTWAFVVILTVVLAVNAGVTLGRMFGETAVLVNSGRAGLFGPWFSSFKEVQGMKRSMPAKKKVIRKGLKIALVLGACATPGILPLLDLAPVPVTITPRTDYTMKFNFWAHTILSQYTTEMRTALNDHQVNLDMGTINPTMLEIYRDFETAMPNITYRSTVAPSHFDQLCETLVYQVELIKPYILNGTLDQWLGFAFDVEGDHFRWWLGFDNVEDAVAEWEQAFEYIYVNASSELGFPIEMENVGSAFFDADVLFDGDQDMEMIEGYVSTIPNFTTHAPMVYRCHVDECGASEPFFDPWRTSYSIYSTLTLLNGTVGPDKLGIYLGITNCSCYNSELAQDERVSWGNKTGFGNLIRDTLIAKHFGLKEVTYFLLWTTGDFGGVFDTYGDGFLDVMNETVNTNPPAKFDIFYNHVDAMVTRKLYRDVLGDISRPMGAGLVIAAAAASVFVVILSELILKKKVRKTN